MEIKITFDGTIPQYAEIVNGFKQELEKNVTIRNISKTSIAGGCSIEFDIDDDYFISIWTNRLFPRNTVIVSLHQKYEFAWDVKSILKGEITVSCNPGEPFTCDDTHFDIEDELATKVASAINAVINRMNEKRSSYRFRKV